MKTNKHTATYGSHMNDTGLVPVGYKILVEIPVPTEKQGLIYKPQAVQTKEKNQAIVAKVLQLGHLCYEGETPWCVPGNYVIMTPYTGNRVHMNGDDSRHLRFLGCADFDGIVTNHPDLFQKD